MDRILPSLGLTLIDVTEKANLRAKNRKVIIKFTNSKARRNQYSARKQLGALIYVQENLTNFRESLSYEARQLVKTKKLAKTWVSLLQSTWFIPRQLSRECYHQRHGNN